MKKFFLTLILLSSIGPAFAQGFKERQDGISAHKFRSIAVNCRSGKRSKNAARILIKNAFKVIELDSGFNGWVDKGMPVTK